MIAAVTRSGDDARSLCATSSLPSPQDAMFAAWLARGDMAAVAALSGAGSAGSGAYRMSDAFVARMRAARAARDAAEARRARAIAARERAALVAAMVGDWAATPHAAVPS